MLWLALETSSASTLFPPVSCAATVETQFLFLEELPSCFYCVNYFACVSPMLSLTKDTDWVSLFLSIPMVLSFRSYTSNVSGCIIYFMSSTTAEGCLSRPPYPTPPNFRRFAQYRASLAVFCWEWTSRTPEACRLRPSSATHRNFCSRSRKIPGSSSNWILWWQEGSLFLLRVRSQQVCSGHTGISVFPRLSFSQFHQASGLRSLLVPLDWPFPTDSRISALRWSICCGLVW